MVRGRGGCMRIMLPKVTVWMRLVDARGMAVQDVSCVCVIGLSSMGLRCTGCEWAWGMAWWGCGRGDGWDSGWCLGVAWGGRAMGRVSVVGLVRCRHADGN